MNKQTKRSITELVAIVIVGVVLTITLGLLPGLGATIAAIFVYGVVSVLFKFQKVKAMAGSAASKMAQSD